MPALTARVYRTDVDHSCDLRAVQDCLELIKVQSGMPDPTWQQLSFFVHFLNHFLFQYEQNPFCSVAAAEDLPGFGPFIVKFLKRGATDFSLSSLGGDDVANQDGIEAYLIPEDSKRHWEDTAHPYVTFIRGGAFDFFGFHVDQNGNHLDPQTGAALPGYQGIIPAQLCQNLFQYGQQSGHPRGFLVADYHDPTQWPDEILREKLYKIMELGSHALPDPTSEAGKRMADYKLTGDNMQKILAIMTRFKVGIPQSTRPTAQQ